MAEDILVLSEVCKRFHSVQAVNHVSFSVKRGEVHAICGENGAGKSTLMNLLAGVYQYDEGSIRLNGKDFRPKSPLEAKKAGVSIVFQELSLFPQQSAASNIFAGSELMKGGLLDQKAMLDKTREVLKSMDLEIDPEEPVNRLSIGQRQWVEIARAMANKSEILILDEPNSALNMYETQILFRLIEGLKEKGITILYISHRMDEVFYIADRITVMRDGHYISTLDTDKTSIDEIIALMLGRESRTLYQKHYVEPGETILQVENMTIPGRIEDISFDVRKGQVVGLSGLAGCGYEDVLKVLFGLEKMSSGRVLMDGSEIKASQPLEAMKKQIAMVPSDRHNTGLMTEWTIENNIAEGILHFTSRNGLINHRTIAQKAEDYVEKLNVVCNSIHDTVIELSGGNQQKVLLAKWLAMEPRLLILDDPTRGIDVGAKNEIYQLIDRLTAQGFAIILTSSEIDELIALSDDIVLFRNGRIIGHEFPGVTKGEILKKIAGEVSDPGVRQHGRGSDREIEKTKPANPLVKLLRKKEAGVFLATVLVFLGFSVFVPSFMSGTNMAVILKQMAILALLTYGMMYCFAAAEVDLSVGMVLNVTMSFMAVCIVNKGMNPWIAVMLGLLFATGLGAVNGILAVLFHLPTIVITLGTMSIYRGMALLLNGGRTISGIPEGSFLRMARVKILGVSLIAWISIVIFIILLFAFRHTRYARHILLFGDNPSAAIKMGIRTGTIRIRVMAMSGLLSGIGAVLTLSNLTAADTTTGGDYAMSAIGAVVIGGTGMTGGYATMAGSLIGIVLVTVIQNGLVFLGLQAGWRSLFIGIIMIIAISIDTIVERRRTLN